MFSKTAIAALSLAYSGSVFAGSCVQELNYQQDLRVPALETATAKRLAEAQVISSSDADRWSDALRTADSEGRFFTSYTGFLVSGIRPGGAG